MLTSSLQGRGQPRPCTHWGTSLHSPRTLCPRCCTPTRGNTKQGKLWWQQQEMSPTGKYQIKANKCQIIPGLEFTRNCECVFNGKPVMVNHWQTIVCSIMVLQPLLVQWILLAGYCGTAISRINLVAVLHHKVSLTKAVTPHSNTTNNVVTSQLRSAWDSTI